MSSPNGAAVLRCGVRTQVRHERRTTTVVDRASFDIGRREVLALIGESGSGKTMTALSILRLVAPPVSIAGGRSGTRARTSSG